MAYSDPDGLRSSGERFSAVYRMLLIGGDLHAQDSDLVQSCRHFRVSAETAAAAASA